ncbi:hypothetical protein [Bradyrhizobium tunisiense]|uniref:hypothetical protein n=1 Tax=Bradyrhizobium tunisiense TaxID=3278709 RepID=UPI0035E240F0
MGKIIVSYFRALSTALGGKWIGLPGAVVGLTGLYAFLQNRQPWLPQLPWWVLFPMAAVPLLGWTIVGLVNHVVRLERRLAPRIEITLAEPDGIYSILTSDLSQSAWAQVVIASSDDVPLLDCEVHVTGLARIEDGGIRRKLMEEHGRCLWSDEPENVRRFDIPPMVCKRANLFSRYERQPDALGVHIRPYKMLHDAMTQMPGNYAIDIVVTAKDAAPVGRSFEFHWGINSWDDISLKPLAAPPVA